MLQVDFNEQFLRYGVDVTTNSVDFLLTSDKVVAFSTSVFDKNSVQLVNTTPVEANILPE